jgi:hypothetical protein
VQSAHIGADKTRQEIDMSKGNKEAKKPKRVTPVAKTPVAGAATATPAPAAKPRSGKR